MSITVVGVYSLPDDEQNGAPEHSKSRCPVVAYPFVLGDRVRYRVEELRGLLGCQDLRGRQCVGMIASGAWVHYRVLKSMNVGGKRR